MINYLYFHDLLIQSLCLLEEVLVLNLYKITEPRKHKLKVEILNDLKEFFFIKF